MIDVSPIRLEMAVSTIASEITGQLSSAPKTRPEELGLWAELSCCVLSSQVPYDLARAASQRIMDSGSLCGGDYFPKRDVLRSELISLLLPPMTVAGTMRRYRFPHSRADQIASTFCLVHDRFGSLNELLNHYADAVSVRLWMVKNMQGVGPKQASMFLRNAAISYDLAIIDTHVCQYMRVIGLVEGNLNVATISQYEKPEAKLRAYATTMGCAVGVLDWAIWIVMRAASRLDTQ
jgi:N-glycosylase/DNA lyase